MNDEGQLAPYVGKHPLVVDDELLNQLKASPVAQRVTHLLFEGFSKFTVLEPGLSSEFDGNLFIEWLVGGERLCAEVDPNGMFHLILSSPELKAPLNLDLEQFHLLLAEADKRVRKIRGIVMDV